MVEYIAQMYTFIVKAVFIGIGLVCWIVWTFLKYKKWNDRKNNCTKKISVYVSHILEKKTSKGKVLYKPIFKGIEQNREYIIDSAFYANLVQFEVGQRVELLVNPSNYKQFLYVEDSYNVGKVLDILSCFIPIIFFLIIISI